MTGGGSRYVDRRAAIKAQLREIDNIVLLADAQDDLVVRDYLSRLAVIRLSGFIETSVEHMLNGFLEESTSHRVLKFGKRQVSRLPNMNPTKLEQLVGAFDANWESEFNQFLAQDERRQLLGNLINSRHALAHGGTSTVSSALLRQYHQVADETIEFLCGLFVPLPTPSAR